MWLSEKVASDTPPESRILHGRVTIGGDKMSVYADGELRNVEAWSPAGFRWKPKNGSDILVVKTDSSTVALGSPAAAESTELSLTVGGSSITITAQGIMLKCGGQFINITPGGIESTLPKD